MGKNEFIRQIIGQEYLYRKNGIREETLFVKECYQEMARVNLELFAQIPYEVIFTSEDVYASAADMRTRVVESGKIYIYNGWEGHPFLSMEENVIGRAVHDVWAHLVCGCPFNFEGELTAYYEQRKHYPKWTWDVLFAEIPAQTAAFYANDKSHQFPQRAIVAPQRWIELAEMVTLADYSSNSVLNSLLHV